MTKNLFVGVNVPADPEKLTDLEKKHTPVITAPGSVEVLSCFNVEVEVGKLLAHPNEHDHYITFIDLYADDTYITRIDLTGVTSCPKATVCVKLLEPAKELIAYASCNMHGVWKGVKALKIIEK